jgi:hypothetical protein
MKNQWTFLLQKIIVFFSSDFHYLQNITYYLPKSNIDGKNRLPNTVSRGGWTIKTIPESNVPDPDS